MTRWRSCCMLGLRIRSRSWGCPTRKLWRSARLPTWKFDSMRSSSTAAGARFCASSTMRSALRSYLLGLVLGQHRRFVLVAHCDAESGGDGAQEAVGVELCRHQLRGDDLVAVQLAQQAANERGLARADFAREHDEALALVEPVLEVGVGALVPAAAVKEARIRAELEGRGGKSEVGFEHGSQ